jgi:4'-phosphopantetheinyl transferase
MAIEHHMPVAENSRLEPGRVDIWAADVDCEEAEIQHYSGFLSAAETARSARFRFDRERNRYAARHGILRVLLSAYMKCAPPAVEICSGSNGKPYVDDRAHETALQFSMSHSAGRAVFAFGRSGGVGVDIERISGFQGVQEFVAMNFTSAETQEVECCPESMRLEAFFKLWVRKEAVLKASGYGLAIPLNCVDVSTLGSNEVPWSVRRIEGDASGREFRLTDVMVAPGFAVALAAVNSGCELSVTYRHFEPSMMELGIPGLLIS